MSGAVSHALRPEGQHFKRDDPQTSLQMKPNFHWPNCCGLQEPPPPPPPKPRASGSPLTAVYPKLAWGELRLSNSCAMSQDSRSSSGEINPSVTLSSISTVKCNLGPLLGKQFEILRIQFQEFRSCENHLSPNCFHELRESPFQLCNNALFSQSTEFLNSLRSMKS